MKLIPIAAFLLFLCACNSPVKEETKRELKTIEVRYHKSLETFMILRAICDTDYFMKRVPDTGTTRPMIFKARKFFAAYKNHRAVAETQRLYTKIGDIGGVICQGLLYAQELPGTKIIYEPTGYYWKDNKQELEQYMQTLAAFYKDAHVEEFFKENESFYKAASAEAKSYINGSVIVAMENYFGKQNSSYQMFIFPLSPMGSAFSATTQDSGGYNQYAIISPVKDIDWDGTSEYKEYGFGGVEAKAYYRELVVHEFVHTFITDVIANDNLKKQIDQYDSLYTPALDSMIGDEGYSGWWSYVNELLVRSGHIRVMETLDRTEAEELRKSQKEIRYILIPETEEIFKQYENNRTQYKSIDAFLPQLIQQFKAYNKNNINKKLRAS